MRVSSWRKELALLLWADRSSQNDQGHTEA